MNKVTAYVGIFIISVCISSLSQILLKQSALKNYENRIKEYLNPSVIIAYGMLFFSSILTMVAYRSVPLSMGPILESTGYIFVGVFSYLFLKEKLSKRKLIGMTIIVLGTLIFSI